MTLGTARFTCHHSRELGLPGIGAESLHFVSSASTRHADTSETSPRPTIYPWNYRHAAPCSPRVKPDDTGMTLSEQQKQALLSALASPAQSTSVDGLSVTNQSASEIIRALQFAASVEAITPPKRAFRLNVLRAPGAIDGTPDR